MEERKKAEKYLRRMTHHYIDHQRKCEQFGDHRGVEIMGAQLNRWNSALKHFLSDQMVAGEMIAMAIKENALATVSTANCWERYLLDAFEEMTATKE